MTHKRSRYWLMVIATLVAAAISAAEERTESIAVRRTRALESFDAILRAEPGRSERTADDLRAVLAADPDDALARVHLGWLLVLEARTLAPREALPRARDGFALMDAAVAAAPDDPAVRLVRARSDAQVPRVLGREKRAAADFAWLLARARRPQDDEAPLPAPLRRKIFFHAGAFALRRGAPGEAVDCLQEAARLAASEPSDDDVQSMLALARRELSSQGHGETAHPEQGTTAAP